MHGSLHTANQNAIDNVCSLHHDMRIGFVHYAYMDGTDTNYLRAWREYRGLNQDQLAEKIGTTKAVVSLLENEKRPLSSTWLRKIAKALDIKPGYVLDRAPNEATADILDIWDAMSARDRRQAAEILQTFAKDGTGG